MADDASHKPLMPPRIATAILRFFLRGSDMAPILGDLDEEYQDIAQGSPKTARAWYWRQSLLSTVHIAISRAREQNLHRALIGVAIIFVFLHYWNLWIAPVAAAKVYAFSAAGSYGPARAAFYVVALLGAAMAGAFFAYMIAGKQRTLLHFTLTRALPAAIIVFTPALVVILSAGGDYPVAYRLTQTGLAAISFVAGAGVAFWLIRKRF